MKTRLARSVAFLLVSVFVASPVWATCGGGGGGGGGGMSGSGSGGGSNTTVYHVPWRIRDAKTPTVTAGLVLYWFPASADEIKKSTLLESRDLSMYAGQCISMELADVKTPNYETLLGGSKLPVAVLANPDNTPISRVENSAGKLKVADVEKLVSTEVKTRETKIDGQLADAKTKTATDKDAAIRIYQSVLAEKCMFPKKAKDAAKELKKLGVENVAEIPPAPKTDAKTTAAIVSAMKRGLAAENKAQYTIADKFYQHARNLDRAGRV